MCQQNELKTKDSERFVQAVTKTLSIAVTAIFQGRERADKLIGKMVTDDMEDILVSIHTVQDFLYPEHRGSKLAQYTNNYYQQTQRHTPEELNLCWNPIIHPALFIYKL